MNDHSKRRRRSWRRAVLAGSLLGTLGLTGTSLQAEPPSDPGRDVPSPYPDRVVLTWSADPTTSQSVTWRTDTTVANAVAQYAIASPGPGLVHLASTVPAESRTVDVRAVADAGLIAHYHSVTLRDLAPDTVYAYRVGDGERWSEWFHFRTASREAEPFSFLYFGDAQNDILSLWSRTVRGSFAAAPDARFMIHAGDLVNRAHSDAEWGEWFQAGGFLHAMLPSAPAPGNHEFRPITAEDEANDVDRLSVFWRPQFTLPENGPEGLEEATYFFDYQGARIVVLSSTEGREEQAVWLDRVLSENPQRWTIVSFHHPVFSSARDRDNPELRALWKPIFDRHGVDLVLQGHDHTYARGRTDPTTNAYTAAVAGNDGGDVRTGTVYTVSVGGAKMYDFKKDRWDSYEADLDRRAENTQLYQVVRIDGDRLVYRAHTATGSLYDAFELAKVERGPNRFVERMTPGAPTRTMADPPPYRR